MRSVSWKAPVPAGAIAALLLTWPSAEAMASNTAAPDQPNLTSGSPVDMALADTTPASPAVITIKSAGVYHLTGSLSDGRVVIDTDDDGIVRLILDDVDITSTAGAPIQVANAGEVVLVLTAGSTSVLSDLTPAPTPGFTPGLTPGLTPDPTSAALLSTADLTILGPGSLEANSSDHDGIVSAAGLIIDSGTVVVHASGDGLCGEDQVVINNGDIAVTSGGGNTATIPEEGSAKGICSGASVVIAGGQIIADTADTAIHSAGSVTITGGTLSLTSGVGNEADGIHADTTLDVFAGTITVVNAFEGLEALNLTIHGGTIHTTTSNDGLNASEDGVDDFAVAPHAFIHIGGGTIEVEAGDDGIDSNGTIVVSGGTSVVSPAFDGIDANGSFTMTGGTVVVQGAPVNDNYQDGLEVLGGLVFHGGTLLSVGSSASYTPPSPSSTQGWISCRLGAPQPAGTTIQLVADATIIAAYQDDRAFQSLMFTSEKITNDRPYDVFVGGSGSGTSLGGMYLGGDLSGATKTATVTPGHFAY